MFFFVFSPPLDKKAAGNKCVPSSSWTDNVLIKAYYRSCAHLLILSFSFVVIASRVTKKGWNMRMCLRGGS